MIAAGGASTHRSVGATALRSAHPNAPGIRCWTAILLAAATLVGCAEPPGPTVTSTGTPIGVSVAPPPPPPPPPQTRDPRVLAAEPAVLADDLVAAEQALRDPSLSEEALLAAARRQQASYRALGRHPEWDSIVRPRIPAPLWDIYDRNVSARRHLTALHNSGHIAEVLPQWRIEAPIPAAQLLGHYREAESASGVGWHYLAAVNMIETGFGRVTGVSTAGAQGPMQFLPSTFAAYGNGGDIRSPRDSIMAAGRYLAANGFSSDPDHALFRYNNSDHYVRAVHDYATAIAADPAVFDGYYRWDVYFKTASGAVVLPIGYPDTAPIPVEE
jgi:hypothetical protein